MKIGSQSLSFQFKVHYSERYQSIPGVGVVCPSHGMYTDSGVSPRPNNELTYTIHAYCEAEVRPGDVILNQYRYLFFASGGDRALTH